MTPSQYTDGSALGFGAQGVEIILRQRKPGCAGIFVKMLDAASARNWQHDGAALQKPRQSDLTWRRVIFGSDVR